MEIKLYFYPTGVIEDVRYSIIIHSDSIRIKNHAPQDKEGINEYENILTNEQIKIITTLVKDLKTIKGEKDPSLSDTWGTTLRVNKNIIYEEDDFSIDSAPQGVKHLIEYLIKISPVEIKFYGFS